MSDRPKSFVQKKVIDFFSKRDHEQLRTASRTYLGPGIATPLRNLNPALLTSRTHRGATIDVEQTHVHSLGNLASSTPGTAADRVHPCCTYLSTQFSMIFWHGGVLIHVFSRYTRRRHAPSYYRDYLNALQKYSPDAGVFLLLHKMGPITGDRAALLKHWARELRAESGAVPIAVWDNHP